MPPEFHFERLKPFKSVPLDELIDISLLSNLRTFRARGVRAEDATVYYDPAIPGAFADTQRMEIAIGDDLLLQSARHPEDFYLIAAHELTHFAQPETNLEARGGFATAAGRDTAIHSRDRFEQEAIQWEAQQAARFGWDRDDYQSFVRRMREAGLSYLGATTSTYDRRMGIELRERPYAAIPALSRRPVNVRRHWRRA